MSVVICCLISASQQPCRSARVATVGHVSEKGHPPAEGWVLELGRGVESHRQGVAGAQQLLGTCLWQPQLCTGLVPCSSVLGCV